jgi:hypothetical protein
MVDIGGWLLTVGPVSCGRAVDIHNNGKFGQARLVAQATWFLSSITSLLNDAGAEGDPRVNLRACSADGTDTVVAGWSEPIYALYCPQKSNIFEGFAWVVTISGYRGLKQYQGW